MDKNKFLLKCSCHRKMPPHLKDIMDTIGITKKIKKSKKIKMSKIFDKVKKGKDKKITMSSNLYEDLSHKNKLKQKKFNDTFGRNKKKVRFGNY